MKRSVIMSCAVATVLMGGGFKLSESSTNSVALSAAIVAGAKGADAAYFNPANMAFESDHAYASLSLMGVTLTPANYVGDYTSFNPITASFEPSGPYDINSKTERIFIPSLSFVSPKMAHGLRYGLAIMTPGGLTKRWYDDPGVFESEDFTLKTVEINPTIAMRVSETVAVGVGVRAIVSQGIVKSKSPLATRDMEGDSIDFGYNVAITYKPTSAWTLAATYRSNVDLTLESDDVKITSQFLATPYDESGEVEVPIPAALNLSLAHDFGDTLVELNYERTFWSTYEALDFEYDKPLPLLTNPPVVVQNYLALVYDNPIEKDWKDTNTFRLGITHHLNQTWTLMGAMGKDESPIPDETLSFELPDADSTFASFGGRYRINERMSAGMALLATFKEDRDVDHRTLNGTFSYDSAAAYLFSAGIEYRY